MCMEVVSTIFVHVLLQEEVRTYAGQKRSIARPAVLYVLYMDGDFRIIDDYKCIQGCWFHVHDEKSYPSFSIRNPGSSLAVVLLP